MEKKLFCVVLAQSLWFVSHLSLGCVESNQGNKTNKKRTIRINELRNLLRPQPILLNSVPIFI